MPYTRRRDLLCLRSETQTHTQTHTHRDRARAAAEPPSAQGSMLRRRRNLGSENSAAQRGVAERGQSASGVAAGFGATHTAEAMSAQADCINSAQEDSDDECPSEVLDRYLGAPPPPLPLLSLSLSLCLSLSLPHPAPVTLCACVRRCQQNASTRSYSGTTISHGGTIRSPCGSSRDATHRGREAETGTEGERVGGRERPAPTGPSCRSSVHIARRERREGTAVARTLI